MDAVEYTEPSGDDIADPSPDQVVASMRQGYEDNWGPYSPMGWLKRGNPSATGTWEPFRWDTHKRESPPDDESAVVERAEPRE